jgi:hypothetical protein
MGADPPHTSADIIAYVKSHKAEQVRHQVLETLICCVTLCLHALMCAYCAAWRVVWQLMVSCLLVRSARLSDELSMCCCMIVDWSVSKRITLHTVCHAHTHSRSSSSSIMSAAHAQRLHLRRPPMRRK